MVRIPFGRSARWRRVFPKIAALAGVLLVVASARTQPPEPPSTVLTADEAVAFALRNNPELAALRQQHGFAAAGVVIARTYPLNPVYEGKIRAANGPESAGVTFRVPQEHRFFLELEVRGQGAYRRQGASATLSRTDWEIATQELMIAARVRRAFYTTLYRQQKLRLVEETIRLNEQVAQQVRLLVEEGKLRPADLILIQTEVDDARTLFGVGRTTLETARADLRRTLGVVDEAITLQGSLDPAPPPVAPQDLSRRALDERPDLRARQAALTETEALLRLEIANRYGNPSVGPSYEIDSSRVNMVGAEMHVPLPVLNTHRGEIQQREAARARAALELRQTEIQIVQDVQAAVSHLQTALASVMAYQNQVLPNLRTALADMERLFALGEPGVDVLRLIDVRRKLLRARDSYLDALWDVQQAEADLAAAIGDPFAALPSERPALPPEGR